MLFGGFDHAREQQGGIVDVDTSLYTKKRGAGQNPTSLRTDMETFKKPDPYNRVGVWVDTEMTTHQIRIRGDALMLVVYDHCVQDSR